MRIFRNYLSSFQGPKQEKAKKRGKTPPAAQVFQKTVGESQKKERSLKSVKASPFKKMGQKLKRLSLKGMIHHRIFFHSMKKADVEHQKGKIKEYVDDPNSQFDEKVPVAGFSVTKQVTVDYPRTNFVINGQKWGKDRPIEDFLHHLESLGAKKADIEGFLPFVGQSSQVEALQAAIDQVGLESGWFPMINDWEGVEGKTSHEINISSRGKISLVNHSAFHLRKQGSEGEPIDSENKVWVKQTFKFGKTFEEGDVKLEAVTITGKEYGIFDELY